MSRIFPFGITKLIFSFLKFLFIYLILGTLALFVIAICEGITVLGKMNWDFYGFAALITEKSNVDFIRGVRDFLLSGVPFAEVADKMATDSGAFINIIDEFKGTGSIKLSDFLSNIFPDTVKIIIANFAIFVFARINVIISKVFRGLSVKIGIFISMGIFGVAGFSVSIAILNLIDLYFTSGLRNIAYVVVAIVCFFLHSVFLSVSGKDIFAMNKVIKHLAKNLLTGLINSIICWFVCFHLSGLYNYSHFCALYIAFLIFCLVLMLERNSVKFAFEK